jgi:hypothetical protein
MRDRLELLLGAAGPGRNNRAAESVRAGLENESTGRQVIGKGVVHDVA